MCKYRLVRLVNVSLVAPSKTDEGTQYSFIRKSPKRFVSLQSTHLNIEQITIDRKYLDFANVNKTMLDDYSIKQTLQNDFHQVT